VDWDGKTDFGEYAGNGVYIYIISDNGKILGKGQVVVMD
jgi:flagellar motor switch/type III secretory pathway protein FliN